MAISASAIVSSAIVSVAALQAVWRVRRLRMDGAKVRPLVHDVDLPGHFPPRWLVVLGDSAAAGHGLPDAEASLARRVGRALVAADGRATAVRSVAVDGARTADVLATQLDATVDAEVVLIGVGVNDALRPGRSLPEAATALRAVVEGVRERAAANVRIVLLPCPDLSVAPGLPWVLRPVVGRRCRAMATAQEQVAADLGIPTVRAGRERLAAVLFGPDGFHPGVEGHERLSASVVEYVRSD